MENYLYMSWLISHHSIKLSFTLHSHSLSGGEDCTIRIWSIKTGELIFAQRVADTLFTALCWPENDLEMCGSLLFDVNHSWGAWLGSRDGMFYMHGT
jgi:WD40 repeat protein